MQKLYKYWLCYKAVDLSKSAKELEAQYNASDYIKDATVNARNKLTWRGRSFLLTW